MPKKLIIVESPTKVKTIKRFVGSGYDVQASKGHVRDLPKNALGINIKDGFKPRYVLMPEKRAVVAKLKQAAAKADEVLFASDPDREGEAIAWHLSRSLRIKSPKRLEFNEITKSAITRALEHPRPLNQHLVDAQQARRLLDRLVGYQLSPLLWKKVKAGLSAGRVQSVAVKLVVEREREIEQFVPVEYWSLHALLAAENGAHFKADLVEYEGQKPEIHDAETAEKAKATLEALPFSVKSVKTSRKQRKPAPPFITSTLQQQAGRLFGWSPRRTMSLAQRLYEGIELGPEGSVGLITYMRTDSTRIADEARQAASAFIKQAFGDEFLGPGSTGKRAKGAQEAHEAIRPTDPARTPEQVKPYLKPDEFKLYDLIWRRFIASQMAPQLQETLTVDIAAGEVALFRASHTKSLFAGFTRLYQEAKLSNGSGESDESDKPQPLPELKEGQALDLQKLEAEQHFTKPPARYSEATLVRALEEHGIGRPSTYAPTLETIQQRGYVKREKRQLVPTELGRLVTDLLDKHFPNIMNYKFTADLEASLDAIERGEADWVKVLSDFWGPFSQALEAARQQMEKVKAEPVKLDRKCPECGEPLVIREGRFGKFISCSAYPKCKYTEDLPSDDEESDEDLGSCPKCGSKLIRKRGRYGPFIACSNYPECKYIQKKQAQAEDTGIPCPEPGCTGTLVKRTTRKGKTFWGCSRYPDCKFATWHEPLPQKCPKCGGLLVKRLTRKERAIVCINENCDYKEPLPEEPEE